MKYLLQLQQDIAAKLKTSRDNTE
uniref:Uncharacterized protein n=1 Tax=Physcomitrium patens TaxID=3218 RepID=A0A2K1KM83_PHYPA|nr:hypothetical protein PHYPA_005772 [Physcomitrium patens]